jgi:antitoxin CptB
MTLRKKLLYNSNHRGCKEMDIILGDFFESEGSNLTQNQLEIYANLLDESDSLLYQIFTEALVYQEDIPVTLQKYEEIITKIVKFRVKKLAF